MKVRDQMNRELEISSRPRRIISVVPSQSEFLWHIGLSDSLVGITKFCVHPKEMFMSVARVGGTKKLDIKKIATLNPDLIIGNKEENEKKDIEELEKNFPVWMSDIYTLDDSLRMMERLGVVLNREKECSVTIEQIKKGSQALKKSKPVRTAYLIWKDPFMVAGENNFIDHILGRCGLVNVFSEGYRPENFENKNSRYPAVSTEQLIASNPELILLSSEPYPFTEKHINEIRKICPWAKIKVVDGEMFSWYGSRLIKAFPYLNSFIESLD